MQCSNQTTYVVRRGDTLYHLARHFHTTVEVLMAHNPQVDPYNLRIGSVLTICPGDSFFERPPVGTLPPIQPPEGMLPPVKPPVAEVPPPVRPPVAEVPPPIMPPIAVVPPRPPVGILPPIGTLPPIMPPVAEIPPCRPCPPKIDCNLQNVMRLVWLQHVYWTRMFLVDNANKLKSLPATQARLMQNPKDIAGIFADYISESDTNTMEALLTSHVQIGGNLITALRDNDTEKAKMLNKAWYENADELAEFFAKLNPHYDYDSMHDMFKQHLDLTSQQVLEYLQSDYNASINSFGKIEDSILQMADMLSVGLANP